MTTVNLIYTIPLPEELYEEMLGAFALATGWSAEGEKTSIEHSRIVLNKYVNETIAAYQANQAAEAARVASLESSTTLLESITTTLVVE
jgi:hypothetical protein